MVVKEDIIKSLQQGDIIIVTWLDASVTKGVKRVSSIRDKAIRTTQIDLGFYAGIFKDLRFKREHITLANEICDDQIRKWTSIPLSSVEKIDFIGKPPEYLILNFPEKVAKKTKKIISSIKPRARRVIVKSKKLLKEVRKHG